MKVLSLFDGISCGQLALIRANIEYEKYFASEIDRFAIKVTQTNFPKTIQIGDVREIVAADIGTIDLLLGGSPCQGFSFAGKRLNFEDDRSILFFEYVRLLKEIQPRWFLFENVVMEKRIVDAISELLGVKPIMIQSNLLSAANRKRLYWTNIPNVEQPCDKGITWKDVRQYNVQEKYYYSQKALEWFARTEKRTGKKMKIFEDGDKMQMLEASMNKKYSLQRFFGIRDVKGLRYITPTECERCMNIPDNYTSCVSDTQRYKQLGNGWTVDVVAWILSFIPKEIENEK